MLKKGGGNSVQRAPVVIITNMYTFITRIYCIYMTYSCLHMIYDKLYTCTYLIDHFHNLIRNSQPFVGVAYKVLIILGEISIFIFCIKKRLYLRFLKISYKMRSAPNMCCLFVWNISFFDNLEEVCRYPFIS